MKRIILSIAALVAGASFATAQIPVSQAAKDRAAELVSKMTLEEKCLLIAGQDDGFHTAPIARLGIPSVRMADGPQGVRNKTNSTYYPCGMSLSASFNREVAKGVGEGIGDDASARGVRIMLCPGVNIYRSAYCGRNFEYYGEDPFLSGETAASYISGIQSKRVIATVKHFATNNQEYDRHRTCSYVDERTLNELYFPAFRAAVEKGHVGAVMTSYNPINGAHAAESNWLIDGNLRAWGFDGLVMSDWHSTYSTWGCLTSGLDLEMPAGYVLNYECIKSYLDNGALTEDVVDAKCRHILQTFIAFGLLDKPMKDESIPEDYEPSRNAAYRAALEGPVLLKNDGILPIKAGSRNNIVILGPNADLVPFGGGSGRMDPIPGRNITLYAGLRNLGAKKYKTTLLDWQNLSAADEALIRKATAVIVAAGFNSKTETENSDRTYSLPAGQDELIAKICGLNSKVIVTVNAGGEIDITPWKDKVGAILLAWYGGQEGGHAVADIIAGKVSPSGRLPFTFWGSIEANPVSANYASKDTPISAKKGRGPHPQVEYKEGVFVGYRGVERFGVTPMFPFGYGLTYSSFEYSEPYAEWNGNGVTVSFTVKNTGSVTASEVAQVYVAPAEGEVLRPAHELKGYEKVKLAKGESIKVTVELPLSAFKYYSVADHDWKLQTGSFGIQIGSSSADIKFQLPIIVPAR